MDSPETIRSFWQQERPRRFWSWWLLPELVAVFAVGLLLHTWLYNGLGGPNGDGPTMPGHDSFYHVKMAVLYPEIGLTHRFPWLTTTVFEDHFVSHHYGFHLLLRPFLLLSQRFGDGDPLQGGRWCMTFCFACVLLLFDLLLAAEDVRFRPLWLLMFLLQPTQFFMRHASVRAITPSLAFMLLLLLAMFRRRYMLAGLIVLVYLQLYLGAAVYAPLLVVAYFGAGLIQPPGRRVSWKLPAWTLAGWIVGLLVHPYGGRAAFEFLRLQIFGTGLTPDIAVGSEWLSYNPAWFFAQISGVTLVLLAVALAVRLRWGAPANARELAVLAVSFVLLGLTLKARRFIEYWPCFSVLSSALLAGPVLPAFFGVVVGFVGNWRRTSLRRAALALLVAALLVSAVAAAFVVPALHLQPLTADWPMWMFIVLLVALVPASRHWAEPGAGLTGALLGPAVSAGAVAGLLLLVGAIALRWTPAAEPRTTLGWGWPALAAAYLFLPVLGRLAAGPSTGAAQLPRSLTALLGVTGGVALGTSLLLFGGSPLLAVRGANRGEFQLAAVQEAMDYLRQNSPADSIVFTDDWDVFPVYFYFNHHNRFVTGLDPKFTHARDPVLWERYVRITQGRAPTTFVHHQLGEHGSDVARSICVELDDIRDAFHAEWVVVDHDHGPLARQLEAHPELAELVYTSPYTVEGNQPRYKVYRVKPPDGA